MNVFKCTEYLRRRGKLFHAKEPEKERLVLKLSILGLGKCFLVVHFFFKFYFHGREDVQKESRYLSGIVELYREQPFALEHSYAITVVCLTEVI